MSTTAPHGSIAQLPSERPDLLVFEVRDAIPAEDMSWMADEVDQAFSSLGTIDLLILMRNYRGAEAASAIDPKVMKVQWRSLGNIRRYGVVGAPAWARVMIELFDVIIPVDAKTFDLGEEEEARRWMDRPAERSAS